MSIRKGRNEGNIKSIFLFLIELTDKSVQGNNVFGKYIQLMDKWNEMTAMLQRIGGKNWEYYIMIYLHYLWNNIVLFEYGLRVLVSLYCKL